MKLVRIIALLAMVVMLFASCGKGNGSSVTTPGVTTPEVTTPEVTTPEVTTPPVVEQKQYTVTFVINGTHHESTVAEGELPVFGGGELDYEDSSFFYRFVGWDRELVPAYADATYTAQYRQLGLATYEVRWRLKEGDVYTTVHEGEIPTPPADMKTYLETDAACFTFIGWNKELVPVPANASASDLRYIALYDEEDRYYNVSFRVDGEEIYATSVRYGSYATFEGEEPTKPGYNGVIWLGIGDYIKGDTVFEAGFTKLVPERILFAYEHTLLAYAKGINDNKGGTLEEASALVYMANEVHGGTGYGDVYLDLLAERCAEHLRSIGAGNGNSPYFDLSCNWPYPVIAAGITVCHETPAIWNKLTEEEKARCDLIMECFAYVLTLGTADANNYTTGPGLIGNFKKSWNPNYRLANILPMIFVGRYFGGAEKLDALLMSFSYDDVLARFQEFQFVRAYECWTKEPPTLSDGTVAPSQKEFMENGGPAYLNVTDNRLGYKPGSPGGTGKGVRVAYTYGGYNVDQYTEIFHRLMEYTYSGGAVFSNTSNMANGLMADGTPKAYILDNTISPVEGEIGMMKEFNTGDGNGIRSNVTYNLDNFVMTMSAL